MDIEIAGVNQLNQLLLGIESKGGLMFQLFPLFHQFFLTRAVSRQMQLNLVRKLGMADGVDQNLLSFLRGKPRRAKHNRLSLRQNNLRSMPALTQSYRPC